MYERLVVPRTGQRMLRYLAAKVRLVNSRICSDKNQRRLHLSRYGEFAIHECLSD